MVFIKTEYADCSDNSSHIFVLVSKLNQYPKPGGLDKRVVLYHWLINGLERQAVEIEI